MTDAEESKVHPLKFLKSGRCNAPYVMHLGHQDLHEHFCLSCLIRSSSKPAVTIREQREAAKAMTQYFRDLNAAKNAEKAK